MTRRTVMLFQMAWPDQVRILKDGVDGGDGFNIEAWLLNEDGDPHMLLFHGGPFSSEDELDKTIKELLAIKAT